MAAGAKPESIIAADFTGDGHPELAVTDFGAGTVYILLNDGTGIFSNAPGSPIALGSAPSGMATGDFNGDMHLDLAVADYNTGSVYILLGAGNGSFSQATGSPITVNSELTSIVAGDFGNGEIDLAVASFDNNEVYILAGNGSGGFSNAHGSPVAVGSGPIAMVAGFLNGTTNFALAVDNAYTNSGGSSVSILLNSGVDVFASASGSPLQVGTAPDGITAGLFHGGSDIDLAVSNGTSGTVNVLIGNGSGGFTNAGGSPITVGTSPYSVTNADFNGDGHPDLAVGLFGESSVILAFGNGDGTFAQTLQTVPVGSSPHDLVTADFNGDGVPDLATANQGDDTVSILLTKCR